eukprot:6084657-Amphidinium_carterae.1
MAACLVTSRSIGCRGTLVIVMFLGMVPPEDLEGNGQADMAADELRAKLPLTPHCERFCFLPLSSLSLSLELQKDLTLRSASAQVRNCFLTSIRPHAAPIQGGWQNLPQKFAAFWGFYGIYAMTTVQYGVAQRHCSSQGDLKPNGCSR